MITFEETDGRKKPTYIAKERGINFAYAESQTIFRRVIERARVGIFLADVQGYIFYANHAMVVMLGYESKDDILGTNLSDIVFNDLGKRAEFLKKLNDTGSIRDYELEIVRRDHMHVFLSITSNLIESDMGEVIGIEGIMHDVTERDRLEEALITEKQKMEQLLAFDEAVGSVREIGQLVNCVVEQTAKILEVAKCSLMMLDEQGKTLSIVGAQGLSDQVMRETHLKLGEMIAGVVALDGQPLLVRNIEYDRKFQRANRSGYLGRSFMIVPVKLGDRVVGVINAADKVTKGILGGQVRANSDESFNEIDLRILCAIAREVSVAFENVKLYSELSALEVTDPLTHIYNYRQFAKSLEYEIKRSRRHNAPLSIIMVDIDDFKPYNDTFGQAEGDALLKNLGQIFKDQLREVDIICRYTGNQFAFILPDTDIEGAKLAAKKIQGAVGRYTFRTAVTLSIGIAGYVGEISQYQLVLNADKALYSAQQEGKDRICVFG